MSKRYVIQVNVGGTEDSGLNGQWENVQHPAGGDWKTRSRTTALNDAVSLTLAGETRKLRIAESKPVYETVPLAELNVAEAVELAKQLPADDFEDEVDEDEEEDAEYDGEDDDDTDDGSENDASIALELIDEPGSDGNAHNNN